MEEEKVTLTKEQYDFLMSNQQKRRGRRKLDPRDRLQFVNYKASNEMVEKIRQAAAFQGVRYTDIFRLCMNTTHHLDELLVNKINQE